MVAQRARHPEERIRPRSRGWRLTRRVRRCAELVGQVRAGDALHGEGARIREREGPCAGAGVVEEDE